LKLCCISYYDGILSVQYDAFLQVAAVIKDTSPFVRHKFVEKAHKLLSSLQLPLRYMSIMVLGLADPIKDIIEYVKVSLSVNIKIRQLLLANNEIAARDVRTHYSILPEYSLVSLVHLLAHTDEIENDKPKLLLMYKYINTYIEMLFHADDNLSLMYHIFATMKHMEDSYKVSKTDNIRLLCDLGIVIIRQMSKSKNWTLRTMPGDVLFPESLFKCPVNVLEPVYLKSYLPKDFKLPVSQTRADILIQTSPSKETTTATDTPKKSTTSKKTSTKKESPSKSTRPSRYKKEVTYNEDDNKDEDEEEEINPDDEPALEEIPQPTQSTKKRPVQTTLNFPQTTSKKSSPVKESTKKRKTVEEEQLEDTEVTTDAKVKRSRKR